MKKGLPDLQSQIVGFYPKQRYLIDDPTYRPNDVLKIAYIRDASTESVMNPFTGIPGIVALLPIPAWANGDSRYWDTQRVDGAKRYGYKAPDQLFSDHLFTMIQENPKDLSDFDIVVRHRFADGTQRKEHRFMFTFLFFMGSSDRAAQIFDVTSDFGMDFEMTSDQGDKRWTFFLLIPLRWVNRPDADAVAFLHRFYTEILMSVNYENIHDILRARKRRYIFSKDPALGQMEEYLRDKATTLDASVTARLLRNYKLRFDFWEQRREIEEVVLVRTQLNEVEAQIRASIQRYQQQQRAQGVHNPTGESAETTRLKKLRDTILSNRIDPSQGLVDVMFGRNYFLYDRELARIMLEPGPLEVRQYPISQLQELRNSTSQAAAAFPDFQSAWTQAMLRWLNLDYYRLPAEFERFESSE